MCSRPPSSSRGCQQRTVPLDELVEVDRTSCTPASYGETLIDHFSLPAFDASRLSDRTPGESIKSNKLVVANDSVLVSRLNPSTNRTWFAVPDPGIVAAASTEFMVLRPTQGVGIGALWLAVRDDYFRSELARRATGTSGSLSVSGRTMSSPWRSPTSGPSLRALTPRRKACCASSTRRAWSRRRWPSCVTRSFWSSCRADCGSGPPRISWRQPHDRSSRPCLGGAVPLCLGTEA